MGAARIEEHEGEAGHGDERRQWVERNAKWAREIGAADAEKNHSNLLKRELEQDARDDENSDDLREREEAEKGSDKAEGNERAVGNSVLRMDGSEKAEVVAIARGGVGDAGVAEEQREDAGECGPDDEGGDQVTGPAAEGGVAMSATSWKGSGADWAACVAAARSEGRAARFIRT